MRLTTTGIARNFELSIIGVITTEHLPSSQRSQRIRFVAANETVNDEDVSGYRALLSHDELKLDPAFPPFIASGNPII